MKLNEFLSQQAVFTVDELDRFLSDRGSGKPNTRRSLLTYYRSQGRIVRVRRGLYASVPLGTDPASSPVDPYLVAAKMTADAVLAYHTALEFHGKAYSVYTRLFYISASESLPIKFQSHEIRGVSVPHPLRAKGEEMFGVTSVPELNLMIPVEILNKSWGKCCEVLVVGNLAGSRIYRFQGGDGQEGGSPAVGSGTGPSSTGVLTFSQVIV